MNLLEKYLKNKDMTRTEFAKAINRHVSYITHLIKGRRTPSLNTAILIEIETSGEVPVKSWIEEK